MPASTVLFRATGSRQTIAAATLAVGLVVVVGSALLFQHVGGYIPCALCLEQRTPYYIGIPLALVALLTRVLRLGGVWTRGALLLVALCMVWAMALGIYHSGVEWGWWPGPTDCAAPAGASALGGGDLLSAIDAVHPPSCSEAALRILGLSLAGWNAVCALILAAVGFWGALARANRFA